MTNKEIKEELAKTDIPTIRVLEDLINILVKKGTIKLSCFSDDIREKLEYRNKLRNMIK